MFTNLSNAFPCAAVGKTIYQPKSCVFCNCCKNKPAMK